MGTELDDQQKVLSEVSHDLANRFHRSYYFLDLLEDALAEGSAEAGSLLGRLRESVSDIESMARGALDFVRPLELQRLDVSVADLVASLRQHAGLREVALEGDEGVGTARVSVDPARISATLAVLGREATAGDASATPLRVELLGGAQAGLRLYRVAAAADPSRSSLPLAACARIARLHGGCLEVDDGAGALTLWLPVAGGGN